jgi:hypothetical protein
MRTVAFTLWAFFVMVSASARCDEEFKQVSIANVFCHGGKFDGVKMQLAGFLHCRRGDFRLYDADQTTDPVPLKAPLIGLVQSDGKPGLPNLQGKTAITLCTSLQSVGGAGLMQHVKEFDGQWVSVKGTYYVRPNFNGRLLITDIDPIVDRHDPDPTNRKAPSTKSSQLPKSHVATDTTDPNWLLRMSTGPEAATQLGLTPL